MMKTTDRILAEIKKVVAGKDEVCAKVLMTILAGGHVLLEDVPGVGKTTLALAFARALGLESRRVQLTSDTVPSDILGCSIFVGEKGGFVYKPGAIMTNLLLADEINRTSSKTQSALLEAMEEGGVTADGVTYPLPEPFVVLATQNPAGSAGTQLLPNSQLDRFTLRLSIGYPDRESQIRILRERHEGDPLDGVRPAVDKDGLLALIREAAAVRVTDELYGYMAALAEATRTSPLLSLGVSPRGALALCGMAKARAFVAGRDFVVPEDALEMFADVCRHRVVLSSRAKLSELDAGTVLNELSRAVPAPEARDMASESFRRWARK